MFSFIIPGDATGSSKRLSVSKVVSYECKQSEKTITLVSVISPRGKVRISRPTREMR